MVQASPANHGGSFEVAPPLHGAQFSKIKKRSYKRAVRRAQLQGETMYRGRRLVAKSPMLPVIEEPAVGKLKPRIRFLSWNVSGLSDILFTELLQWLQKPDNREINILILQETHWNFSGDWTAEEWHFCHSTSGRKGSGGVMIGVRRALADSQQIRWHEAVPGRLLQVRCFLGLQQVDILGFYQHALLQQAGKCDVVLEQRRLLMNKLDQLLASLPARSHIVLGGDFNTTLVRESKVSGFGLLTRELPEKERVDQDRLQRVLQRHKLAALNTWGRKKAAATYIHAKGGSQIDFVCVRQSVADGEAKRTSPKKTPMAGWRTTGHLVPCSKFDGGEIWVQDSEGCTFLSPQGSPGNLWDASSPTRFDPSLWHATAPWGGDRVILIGYQVRHVNKLSPEDESQLRELGFNPDSRLA